MSAQITNTHISLTDLKTCPDCKCSLPINDFGFCAARKDRRNLYCKSCVRKRVARSKSARRNYESLQNRRQVHRDDDCMGRKPQERSIEGLFEARPEHFNQPWPTLRTETFVQMVFGSICKLGRATQQAIVTDTKLHKDTVGLAIADLLLWNKRIGTAIDQHGDTRVYFARGVKR